MKYEHVGFLCSHALKVLDHHNVKVVPSYYILKRWTKDARIGNEGGNNGCPEEDHKKLIASRYKDLCRNIIQISSRAAVSDPAFEFAARQLDEVMKGVERILNFKLHEEAKGFSTSSMHGGASENGLADIDLVRNDFQGQDNDILKGTAETESMAPDKNLLSHFDDEIPNTSGGLGVRPPEETLLSVACAASTYISPQSPNSGPLTQGLYTIQNHMVQSMYQAPDLTITQQPTSNLYEPNSYYSNEHHSPTQEFLQSQEPLIRNQFQESIQNGTQLRQVMNDNHHVHSSSFMQYNHKYGAAGV